MTRVTPTTPMLSTRSHAEEALLMRKLFAALAIAAALVLPLAVATPSASAARPFYEPAYVDGSTVTINVIEVKQGAPLQAQADFYQVVYPIGWQTLGLAPPQCNPCDHEGNGIDYTDFHDHVLDSMPASPGQGEFTPLWHVFLVVPNYTGDAARDASVMNAYAARIPTTSEAAVDALLATKLADGSPVAVEIDTHFYFLCAVVDGHAAR
jgi:hypothetical protein